ncbi:uncharacterized protein [Littorina saxatilis]|uniref:Uncharacterized protein n=1 Tax=Littorina saxatilis TaxID=31220 RepID=A0AAN9G5L6_9CAEN
MANLVLLCPLLIITGWSSLATAAPGSEHDSCQVWDRIAQQLTTNTGAQQSCWSNYSDPCTRIDCSGAYEYNSKNTFGLDFGKSIEVDYCFGIILNHCDKNISLDFYMQVPAKDVEKTTRVYHNTLLSIPGLSFAVSRGTSAQGYLYFEMGRQNNSVTFSVTVKVRVSFAGFTRWPTTLQRRLIANETVPVPPCDSPASSIPAREPTLQQCHPPHWKMAQSSTGPSIASYAGDLGKLCNETDWCSKDPWLACDDRSGRCSCMPEYNQITDKTGNVSCQPVLHHGLPCISDDQCSLQMSERCVMGKCQCSDGNVFNQAMSTCEPAGRVPKPKAHDKSATASHSAAQPHLGPTQKAGQNKTAVIAGAVVGGLVVLAGILLVAYFAIRRLRRPYHNSQLLLEGDDGDGIM